MINISGGKKLVGVIPALILTLEESGKINFKSLEKQVNYLSCAGVDGVFINGTTGEGAWLSIKEKVEVFKLVKEVCSVKQFLCAACIQPSTEMVMSEVKIFEKYRPDYIVAVTPYYYGVSQETIIKHFKEIAHCSSIPLILYNIPQCTHNTIELSTVLELAKVENIAGLKDSSGDFISFTKGIFTPVPKYFSWIQGRDFLDAPSLACGADGIVTGMGNVFIEPYVQMSGEAKKGNYQKVNEIQKEINKLLEIIQITGGKTISSIKAATELLGRGTKWMKMLSLTLDDKDIGKIKNIIIKLGLLN